MPLTDVGDSAFLRLALLLSSFCKSSCLGSHLYVGFFSLSDSEALTIVDKTKIIIFARFSQIADTGKQIVHALKLKFQNPSMAMIT